MVPQAPAPSRVLRADCAEVARRVRAGGEHVARYRNMECDFKIPRPVPQESFVISY